MTSPYTDVACRYLAKPGAKNTDNVLEAVARRAKELDVRKVLVASSTGRTALEARKVLDHKIHLIAVSHVTGYVKPNFQELSETKREELESLGIKVLTGPHAFGGVGRGVRHKLGTYQVDEIIAYSLRVFGQGTKVAIELALMAADAGLVRTDEDVISIAGSGRGADTALLLQPANSAYCFDLKVWEVICKPVRF
ncbi:MAG: hypothetical protein HY742_00550 [Deltaproteobacteria bacterium]|nr:hypothetical protein [Deltaproteobacteria bacterium]